MHSIVTGTAKRDSRCWPKKSVMKKITYIFVFLLVICRTYGIYVEGPRVYISHLDHDGAEWQEVGVEISESTNQMASPVMKVWVRPKANPDDNTTKIQPDALRRKTLWTSSAVNAVLPYYVRVSDDGLYVVTLGNCSRTGQADDSYARNDELAVYKEGKVLAQYSLDEVLGEHFEDHGVHRLDCPQPPAWLCYSDEFFFSRDGRRFCILLERPIWRWVVVDLSNGALVEVSGQEMDEEMDYRYANSHSKWKDNVYKKDEVPLFFIVRDQYDLGVPLALVSWCERPYEGASLLCEMTNVFVFSAETDMKGYLELTDMVGKEIVIQGVCKDGYEFRADVNTNTTFRYGTEGEDMFALGRRNRVTLKMWRKGDEVTESPK